MDRGSPPCVHQDVRSARLRCLLLPRLVQLFSSSFCPSQRSRDVGLSCSESSSDVVAPVLVPVASENFDLDFLSIEEPL